MKRFGLITFGASSGGLHAVKLVLSALPKDFPYPIAIVLHRERNGSDALRKLLQADCKLPVLEIHDKQPIQTGQIYLAPSNYHILVGDGQFQLSTSAAIHFSRPSIDVLFETAAKIYGPNTLGVLLTGANEDGANGMLAINQAGGRTIAQTPETAEHQRMPQAAIDLQCINQTLSLEQIASELTDLATPAMGGSR